MQEQTTCATVYRDGVSVFADGLAFDPVNGALVAASLLGYPDTIKAIWAAFMSNLWIEVRMPNGDQRGLMRSKEETYLQVPSPRMPESRAQHFVLIQQQATKFAAVGTNFYLLTKPREIHIEAEAQQQFVQRFNHLMTVPVELAWFPYLWKQGLKKRFIHEASSLTWTRSFGFVTWRVDANRDPWLEMIEQGIRKGEIQ